MSHPTDAVSPHPGQGPLPLAIGVTGHRDPREQDLVEIKFQIRSLFEEIKAKNPYTPLVLLSSLAEGADRIVAHIALEMNMRVIPVLPMPREEYVKDFPNTIGEFVELLNHPGTEPSVVIPWANCNVSSEDDRRAIQYFLAGVYVAERSQNLTALWDGSEDIVLGGTAHIVAFRRSGELNVDLELEHCLNDCLNGIPEPYWLRQGPLDPPRTGPVCHIFTPRSNTTDASGIGSRKWLAPESYKDSKEREEYFSRVDEIQGRINTFNEDVVRLLSRRQSLWEDWEQNREWIFPDKKTDALSDSQQALRNTYASADTLAMHFQHLVHGLLIRMFVVVYFAVALFAAYAHLITPHEHIWLLASYITLLTLADILYIQAKRRDYQNKYQDYRALAEGLRVQFFWRLAGLENLASDHYLRKQKNELDWIRYAIQSCGIITKSLSSNKIEDLEPHWIKDQHNYFTKASERDFDKLIRLREIGSGLLLVSLGLSVSELFFSRTHCIMPIIALAAIGVGLWHLLVKKKDVMKRAKEDAESEGKKNQQSKASTNKEKVKEWLKKNFWKGVFALPCLLSVMLAVYEVMRDHSIQPSNFLALFPGLVVLVLSALRYGPRLTRVLNRRYGWSLAGVKPESRSGVAKTMENYFYGINLGLLMTWLLLGAPGSLPQRLEHYFKDEHHDWIVVAMGLTAVAAALLHGYAEKRALAEHHKQYKRMETVFGRAMEKFKKLPKDPKNAETRDLILDLGKEALAEHGDWVLLHRERPIELPKAEI